MFLSEPISMKINKLLFDKDWSESLKILVLLVFCFLGSMLHIRRIEWTKWLPFFFAPLGFLFVLAFLPNLSNRLKKLVSAVSTLLLFVFGCYWGFQGIIFLKETQPGGIKYSTWLFPLVVSFVFAVSFTRKNKQDHTNTKSGLIEIIFFTVLGMIMWISQLELLNGRFFISLAQSQFALIFCSSVSGLIAVLAALLGNNNNRSFTLISYLVLSVVLGIDCFLAFRTDAFFMGSSEMHWEYFVGPIRNVKEGGVLLWDVPSQYGFLNILLASWIPAKTSWEAFYFFQSTLLIITSIFFKSVIWVTSNSLLKRTILFVFSTITIFFIDPALIGPSLYPSSSVVRFFWCYLSLSFIFFLCQRKNLTPVQIARWISICTPGIFWSAESAIYVATIMGSSLIFLFAVCKERKMITRFLVIFSPSIMGVLVIFGLVNISYSYRLNHFPDWSMFLMHALSYARGFGSVPINYFGCVGVVTLLFFSIASLIFQRLANKLEFKPTISMISSIACLWAVASYFIGRAVPHNITAILPIVVFMIVILNYYANLEGKTYYGLPFFRTVSGTLLFLIWSCFWGNPALYSMIPRMTSVEKHVVDFVRPIPGSLNELLLQFPGFSVDEPVVYWGPNAAMMRLNNSGLKKTFENTWLPNPLALLSQPIKPSVRKDILKRFFKRKLTSGYFIYEKSFPNDDELKEWENLLTEYYVKINELENSEWKVSYFKPKTTYEF
jgi:hypothetical protein